MEFTMDMLRSMAGTFRRKAGDGIDGSPPASSSAGRFGPAFVSYRDVSGHAIAHNALKETP
jgi:hypothetical protein